MELCQDLLQLGAKVQAFDPAVTTLPDALSAVALAPDLAGVLGGADAAVVCTEWPQFRDAEWELV